MGATRDLTKFYGNFFLGAADLACYPYTRTFLAAGNNPHREFDFPTAIVAVGILTFVVPILPVIFSVTSAIASVLVSLAVASMFLLYPAALLCDVIIPNRQFGF